MWTNREVVYPQVRNLVFLYLLLILRFIASAGDAPPPLSRVGFAKIPKQLNLTQGDQVSIMNKSISFQALKASWRTFTSNDQLIFFNKVVSLYAYIGCS